MMAVEFDLQRAGELLLCSREFQLAPGQNDVVLCHDDASSEKRFDDPQKPPWDFDAPNYNALSSYSYSSESELASSSTETETEPDNKDEYCIAEFTREVTRHMTPDPEKGKESTWDFGGWPYTTQPWSPFGSSYGSTEGSSSREATPPVSPAVEKRHAWDSSNLDNITASMEKMNINDKGSKYLALNQSFPTSANPVVSQDPTLDQIRALQFYKLKQELLLRQQSETKRVKQQLELNDHNLQYAKKEKANPCGGRPRQPWTNWPNQQQGSGMRAVFLSGSGPKSGSGGTGVFLPCVIGDTSQSRKKKGCSPVLIPAKVMQALKVHFDRMGNSSRQNAPIFQLQNETLKREKDGMHSSRVRVSPAAPAMNQNDMGLPQDWTY